MAEILDFEKFRQKKLEKNDHEKDKKDDNLNEQKMNPKDLPIDLAGNIAEIMFLRDEIDEIMTRTKGCIPTALEEGRNTVSTYSRQQLINIIRDSNKYEWNKKPGFYRAAAEKLINQLGTIFNNDK